jgi:amidase
LRAILEINAAALQQAADCDQQRKNAATGNRMANLGVLHGIPILIKDNIATASPIGWEENLNTSAGSLALQGCYPAKDATVIRKLRDAGAIILGKTNMVPNDFALGFKLY